MTEIPSDESPAIRAAREQEAKAADEAQRARSVAEAAQRAVEQATEALGEKEKQVAEVRTQFETVGERLAGMPLDDPDSERIGGRHRHLEIVLRRLESEHGGCHETLLTAQRRAEESLQAAEVASAGLRNAQRHVTLQRLCAAFPVALEKLLDLTRGRNQVLGEADEDSRTHDLPRLGRSRLLPRQDQLRRHESYELATILTRHEVGLAITPSAPFSAFSLDSGEDGGEGVSEAEIPNSEEDWEVLIGALEGASDE